jgi:hypothetical protein
LISRLARERTVADGELRLSKRRRHRLMSDAAAVDPVLRGAGLGPGQRHVLFHWQPPAAL